MAIFSVLRAGRKQEGYMDKLIESMYQDEGAFFKRGYGVDDQHPQIIINAFRAFRNVYYKINDIECYYLQIIIEHSVDPMVVSKIAHNFGFFLFKGGFQNYVTTVDTGSAYIIAVAINSVSYVSGRLFWDNNAVCCEMYQYLCGIMPENIKLHLADYTMFVSGTGNYAHGLYV